MYPAGAALDEFLWRVSIADVERDGPFSRFPGIDRTIVLLEGAGMRLRSGRLRYRADDALSRRMTSAATMRSTARWWRDLVATSTRCSGVTAREDASLSFARGDVGIRPDVIPASVCGAGPHECTIAGLARMRLDEGHALLVDATDHRE